MEEELSLGAEEQEVWLVQLESEKIGCALLGCMLGSASSSAGAPAAGCLRMVAIPTGGFLGMGIEAQCSKLV